MGVNIIPLYNRYYKNVYLKEIDNDLYQLFIPSEALEYMSITCALTPEGVMDYTNIQMIDPSGGPFLAVGNKLGSYIITRITSMTVDNIISYILELKKDEQ